MVHPLRTGWLSVLLICADSTARAAAPHLVSIVPTGGQRGTLLELQFKGERLEDTQEIICYEPGLQVLKLSPVTNKIVRAQLKIAPDCRLGEQHLRLRTASGLSELRTFLVGPFPVIDEIEPNNEPAKAQAVPLNTTVAGVIKNEDVDCFSVEIRQGQRLSAEVEGLRLGRTLFDPRLSVLETNGTVLADVDDTWLAVQDPFVSLIAPHDGRYIIALREATYGGSDDCQYRLHIGSFPRPTSIFPLGGRVGETVEFNFFSEATGEFKQKLVLPDLPQEKFGVFARWDDLEAPSPNWIRVSAFPNVLASAPNQDREHATVTELEPPIALNGILREKAQEDWFRFRAVKGVPLEAALYARRLRSPLDSVLEIFDAKGQSLASNDDSDGADSALKFTPSESTNCFARIRDSLGDGGRDFTYRLEIVPAEPRLAVKIPEVARNDTQSRQRIAVPRGNRFATVLSAKRFNFSGELSVAVDELPAGIKMQAETLAANVDALPVVFEATADAPLGAKLVELNVHGSNAASQVSGKFIQEAELVEGPPNNTAYYSTRVDKLCVAVTREAPFNLRVIEPPVPLVQAGSMRLEVAADRAPGFDEPIELQMVWNPPGVSSQSEATISKGATNAFYQLNASSSAELRKWKIAVLGHATVEGGELYASSQLAGLEVAAPFLKGKIETAWVNPGKPGRLTVNLEHGRPFDGKAVIRLCGLPEKITAAEREITKDDQEVVFDLAVDAKCAPGSHKNLFCAVDVTQNGQVIPHTLGAGGILRVVAPKKEERKLASQ